MWVSVFPESGNFEARFDVRFLRDFAHLTRSRYRDPIDAELPPPTCVFEKPPPLSDRRVKSQRRIFRRISDGGFFAFDFLLSLFLSSNRGRRQFPRSPTIREKRPAIFLRSWKSRLEPTDDTRAKPCRLAWSRYRTAKVRSVRGWKREMRRVSRDITFRSYRGHIASTRAVDLRDVKMSNYRRS